MNIIYILFKNLVKVSIVVLNKRGFGKLVNSLHRSNIVQQAKLVSLSFAGFTIIYVRPKIQIEHTKSTNLSTFKLLQLKTIRK